MKVVPKLVGKPLGKVGKPIFGEKNQEGTQNNPGWFPNWLKEEKPQRTPRK